MDLVERTRAAIQLSWIRVRLPYLLATQSLDDLLAQLTGAERASTTGGVSFVALERALDRAERWTERLPLLPRTCLYRCLARYAVFRSHGFPAEFVMAIAPSGPDADGHAWLELDGTPYREDRAADFLVSFRYPKAAA